MRSEPFRWIERYQRWPAPAMLATAFAAGLVWGALARGWMRLISTDPEFTTSGSVFIAVAFGIVAVSQAVALLARRRPRHPAVRVAGRAVGIIGLFPLFFGGGAVMLPTVLGGGLGLGQAGWPRPARAAAGAIALLPVATVATAIVNDFGASARTVGALVAFGVLYGAVVVVAAAASLGRDPAAPALPRSVRLTVGAAVIGLLLVSTVGLAGLRP